MTAAALLGTGAGLFGAVDGWADILNHFAPLWLALGAAGGAAAGWGLPHKAGRAAMALASLSCLVAGGPIAAEAAAGAFVPAPPAGGAPLRVLTFNVWDGNLTAREGIEMIRASGADVVSLEEPTPVMALYPELAGLYPFATPCGAGCDVAILSKRPFRSYRIARDPGPGLANGRASLAVVWADLTAPDGAPFRFAAAHLPWPAPPDQQRTERAQLAGLIEPGRRPDLVLAGDFNLTPWSFAMRSLERGLSPLTRRTRAVFSYPSRIVRPFPVALLPIDHIWAGPRWRTLEVRRLANGGSDHYPVLAVLSRASAR